MKTYTNDNPEFSDSIQILTTSDPGHADNVNVTTKQLQDNALALKKMIDEGGVCSLATKEEVEEMADELIDSAAIPEVATDEEVDEMIDDLIDL